MTPADHVPDPLAPEEPAPASVSRGPLWLRQAVAAVALLFFAGPLVLAVLGVSGGRVAGEPPARRPALSQGWDVFDSGARWFAIHLPGRRRAIRANNWISREVFGTPPVYGVTTVDRSLPSGGVEAKDEPEAARTGGATPGHAPAFAGLHGWTFLQADLDRNCHPPVTASAALRRWLALVHAIRSTGRSVVLLLAPEKSTIYPELVGPRAINGACALHNKARLWARIERAPDPAVVPLRTPLLERKRSTQEPLYLSTDSHWNDLGAIELTRRALDRVGGGAAVHSSELVRGTARYASDLSRFTGQTAYETTPTLTVRRRGAPEPSVQPIDGGRSGLSTVGATRAPLIAGRTVFLGDSFGDAPLVMLRHYSRRLVNSHWQSGTDLIRLVGRADTVILEAVERSFLQLPSPLPVSDGGSILTLDLISRLRLLRDPAAGRGHAARPQ